MFFRRKKKQTEDTGGSNLSAGAASEPQNVDARLLQDVEQYLAEVFEDEIADFEVGAATTFEDEPAFLYGAAPTAHQDESATFYDAAPAADPDEAAPLYEAVPMARQAEPSFTGSFHVASLEGSTPSGLKERLDQLDESFAQTVLKLIDERNLSDVEVYKRANMSRQLFAKIRKDDNYRPTKRTACALAIALELDHDDALALLDRAGFTLSHSSKFDVIVEYFLVNQMYNIQEINSVLYSFDQQLLS